MKKKKRVWNWKYLLQFANLNAGHFFEDVYYLKDVHFVTGFMWSCKIYIKYTTVSFNWIFIKRQERLLFGSWRDGNKLKELKCRSFGTLITKARICYFSWILSPTTLDEDFYRRQGIEKLYSSCETSLSGYCSNDFRMVLQIRVFQTLVRN